MNHENETMTGLRFLFVTTLNLIITVAEIIGGVLSGSLALLSDAFHNLGDSLSIVLGYVAQRIGGRPQNSQQTFGYRRAEILAAFVNGLFLIGVSLVLMFEAAQRFMKPEPINGGIMLTVAVIGLLANVISALLMHHGAKDSLNIRATYLHIMADALSSVAVIVGGIIIVFFNLTWVDPLLTLLVSFYIIYETWPVIRDTVKILMQTAPDLDYDQIAADIKTIPGVIRVHHIHAWQIDENKVVFSAHVNLKDVQLSVAEETVASIKAMLMDKYHICHVTIQPEVHHGETDALFVDKDRL
ncbi:cation diffusion facilitator family transporter [Furfurilactobacillus siliginis]|uniref:Cation diffusion facilitator family transporter n=1 Tax=Furfurilactobacillus siliginis TaxID=348151 RepID=A0A0R2KXV9_9LACO|nr:cation diffusion facilitator family transporter [Furfurilactobacillus siliginis]KRN94222.1 cation diffusion facilitator family transporter [Furfurilactobacillus siliginis]GEK29676.1 cobalt transporter [Furfurilactobacillus siliginis]